MASEGAMRAAREICEAGYIEVWGESTIQQLAEIIDQETTWAGAVEKSFVNPCPESLSDETVKYIMMRLPEALRAIYKDKP